MNSSEMTVGIIGAGLAGILTARTCLEHKIKLHGSWIMEIRKEGLVYQLVFVIHFQVGLYKSILSLADAVRASTQMFDLWKTHYPDLIRETSIVRPLLGKGGERLKKSYTKTYIDEAQPLPSWLTLSYNQQSNPLFLCDDTAGSVVYSPAFAVDLAEILALERAFFSVQHVRDKPNRFVYSDTWSVWNHQNPQKKWQADVIILCLGRGMNEVFPKLQLGEYGGEMLMCDLPVEFDELYSANGRHIGRHHSGKYVFGATRWIEKRKPTLHDDQSKI